MCVCILPMYLCKASDECGTISSFKLLEAAPVCQPADYLDTQTDRQMDRQTDRQTDRNKH